MYPFKLFNIQTPFLSPFRTMPVYFAYNFFVEYKVKIHIPEGKKIVEMPKDFNLSINGASVKSQVALDDEFVKIVLQIEINNAKFETSQYLELRDLFFIIEEFINSPIVFE